LEKKVISVRGRLRLSGLKRVKRESEAQKGGHFGEGEQARVKFVS
jgi:hypothetical protein